MVRFITPLISAALLARFALAVPLPTNHEDNSVYQPGHPYYQEQPSHYEPEESTKHPEESNTYPEEYKQEWQEPKQEWQEPKQEWQEPPRYEDEHPAEQQRPTEEHKPVETYPAHEEPKYGSGYDNWGEDYDNCVRQCMQTYAPPSEWKPSPTSDPAQTGGVSGTGATHTVIVAPTKGVFRYIPFATNASIGDTIEFVWGAEPHTVSKGSKIEVCNRTEVDFFTSGRQNTGFVYREVVNNTDPIYYFCGVPGHCQQGMFGLINPPASAGSTSAFSSEISNWAEKNPAIKEAWSYTQNLVKGTQGEYWGDSINVSEVPDEAKEEYALGVLYTRMFIANNPNSFQNGEFKPPSQGLTIPSDIRTFLSASVGNPADAASAPPPGTPTGEAPVVPTAAQSGNGAGSVKGSSVAVALTVAAAAFFLL